VNSLLISEQNDPKILAARFHDWRPPSNTPILLHNLLHGMLNHILNPLQLDTRSVGALTHREKILGKLHTTTLSDIVAP
jgi:hypothetical protein